MCYLRCRQGDYILEPKDFPKLVRKSPEWHHLPTAGNSYLRRRAMLRGQLACVLMEMKSSAYGNLNAKANVINLTKFKEYLDN